MFKTEFNHDTEAESLRYAIVPEGESMTVQDEAGEADINQIMSRFGVTGNVSLTKKQPLEPDYLRVSNFHEAANIVREAQESFNELPADIRAKFENDPGRFESFLQDPDNAGVCLKSGLVNKILEVKAPEPIKVQVVNQEAPPPVVK